LRSKWVAAERAQCGSEDELRIVIESCLPSSFLYESLTLNRVFEVGTALSRDMHFPLLLFEDSECLKLADCRGWLTAFFELSDPSISLPSGLQLDRDTGEFHGTPTAELGRVSFNVMARFVSMVTGEEFLCCGDKSITVHFEVKSPAPGVNFSGDLDLDVLLDRALRQMLLGPIRYSENYQWHFELPPLEEVKKGYKKKYPDFHFQLDLNNFFRSYKDVNLPSDAAGLEATVDATLRALTFCGQHIFNEVAYGGNYGRVMLFRITDEVYQRYQNQLSLVPDVPGAVEVISNIRSTCYNVVRPLLAVIVEKHMKEFYESLPQECKGHNSLDWRVNAPLRRCLEGAIAKEARFRLSGPDCIKGQPCSVTPRKLCDFHRLPAWVQIARCFVNYGVSATPENMDETALCQIGMNCGAIPKKYRDGAVILDSIRNIAAHVAISTHFHKRYKEMSDLVGVFEDDPDKVTRLQQDVADNKARCERFMPAKEGTVDAILPDRKGYKLLTDEQ
jgi:hypothetical protein